MPRISLYRPQKTNDFRFIDRTVSEQFTAGGIDLFIHKYLGPQDQGATASLSQPRYNSLDPMNIQDLLFLENRDRKYSDDIYRLRGHYQVQNLDFNLSQFGLFLNNDILFVTVHYNDMIETIGRKLMVGDVLEMPHLKDYHPLNDTIPTSLRRYYQVTDTNWASEGYSATWYPHLWRLKCEPLVDSQEFANILDKPQNTDNYLGQWNSTTAYQVGYVVSYGDKNYTPKSPGPVPIGTPCTDTTYWNLTTADSLKDIISRYNKNIEINEAMIAEASRLLPSNGYDRSQLYLVPTNADNEPAAPRSLIVRRGGPQIAISSFQMANGAVPLLRIGAGALKGVNALGVGEALQAFMKYTLEIIKMAPEVAEGGSKSMEPELVLSIKAFGPVTEPFGTVDNTYSDAGVDVSLETFNTDIFQITEVQDFRADADPNFKFVAKESPKGFGYTNGYLSGQALAPNGEAFTSGIEFPSNPKVGSYFLRLDYLPQQMFRWDGNLWVKISENVRATPGYNQSETLMGSFVNNSNVTPTLNGPIPEQQALSTILGIQPD
jgi:hypothetical protein